MSKDRSITFVYPSRQMGGAQFLFLRLAKELTAHSMIAVNYVDYMPGGFSYTQLNNNHDVTCIPYNQGDIPLKDTTVITSAFHIPFLRMMLGPSVFAPENNVSFLFWAIHPENVRLALYAGGRRFIPNLAKRKRIINKFAKNGSIIFMDGANVAAFEDTVGPIPPQPFIPIPVELPSYSPARLPSHDEFCICWVGRLGSDKEHSVEKIIQDIAKHPAKDKIKFLIVGGGAGEKNLKELAKNLDVTVEMAGYLHGANLHNKLRTDVDLGVAMGTSCLEIASLGIPVALIDFSFSTLPEGLRYDWIFDTQNFDLGRQADITQQRAWSLGDLVDQVLSKPTYGKKCYDYVAKNHEIALVASELVKRVRAAETDLHCNVKEQDIINLLPRAIQAILSALRILKHTMQRVLLKKT